MGTAPTQIGRRAANDRAGPSTSRPSPRRDRINRPTIARNHARRARLSSISSKAPPSTLASTSTSRSSRRRHFRGCSRSPRSAAGGGCGSCPPPKHVQRRPLRRDGGGRPEVPAPRWTVELDPWQLARTLGSGVGPGSTFRRMAGLWCPQCGERVLDTGTYTIGQHHARNQRSTCPQCHAELVRHPDLEDNTWTVDDPTPPPDEELGGSG